MSDNKKQLKNHLSNLVAKVEKEQIKEAEKQQLKAVKIANSPIDLVSWKADRRMTSYPLFAPDKKTRYDKFEYSSPDGSFRLKVFPHTDYGRAKVWDADVFTYFLSRAYEAHRITGQIPRSIETTAYQVLKAIGKSPEDTRTINWLRDAIRRLGATSYQANFFDGVKGGEQGFNLLNYGFEEDERNGKVIIKKIKITFNTDLVACWLFDMKHILSLPNGVLEESIKEQKSGLRKRILLLVGTRLGNQKFIRISLENFKGLCGYQGQNKHFKSALKAIISSLPWEFSFEKQRTGKGYNILIAHRSKGNLCIDN